MLQHIGFQKKQINIHDPYRNYIAFYFEQLASQLFLIRQMDLIASLVQVQKSIQCLVLILGFW